MFECSLMTWEMPEAALEDIREAILDDAEGTRGATVMRRIERRLVAEEAAEPVAA